MSDIQIKVWIKRGNMLVNTSSLDVDDPDHPYNQIVAQGGSPDDYGYENPKFDEFKGLTREQLIDQILKLRKDLTFLSGYV